MAWTISPGYSSSNAEGGLVWLCPSQAWSLSLVTTKCKSCGSSRLPASHWHQQRRKGPGDKDGYRNLSGRLRGTWDPLRQCGIRSLRTRPDRARRIRWLRSVYRCARRHARHQPQWTGVGGIWAAIGNDTSRGADGSPARCWGCRTRIIWPASSKTGPAGAVAISRASFNAASRLAAVTHRLVIAGETEREEFHARDTAFGGFTDQDRTRSNQSVTAEWRADAKAIAGDVVLRRDVFNRFKDATSVRASLLGQLGGGFALLAPTRKGSRNRPSSTSMDFSPAISWKSGLKPESSRGFELSFRYRRGPFGAP